MKWRISPTCPQKNRTEELRNWFLVKACLAENQVSSPDQHASAKSLSPSSCQWTYCLGSGWTSLPLMPCPEIQPTPDPQQMACSSLQPVFPELQFFGYSQINSISGRLSLPWFTSLSRPPGKQDYWDHIPCLRVWYSTAKDFQHLIFFFFYVKETDILLIQMYSFEGVVQTIM